MGKIALVLGGGAPNFTLMSGALLALHRAKLKFDLIYMAGGGAVVGLAYLAPRHLTPEQALQDTVNFGISDAIYSMFPINYKIFSKGGRSAETFREYWSNLPPVRAAMNQYWMTPAEKLESDWLLLQGAMMSPTDVDFFSTGLCAHVPFIENVVDFNKLKAVDTECYINAYCIEDKRPVEFYKSVIDVHHFRAALSFPFLYPPYRIGDKLYYEGAAVDCLNLIEFFSRVNEHEQKIQQVVVLDAMTLDMIHAPRNLSDAYSQSIAVPLVANAEQELDMFMYWAAHKGTLPRVRLPQGRKVSDEVRDLLEKPINPHLQVIPLSFDIPERHKPFALDWSRSNLETLFDVGYKAGQDFLTAHYNGNELQ